MQKHSNIDHLKIVLPICLCSHFSPIHKSLQPDNISGCMCNINVVMWQKNISYFLLCVCCIFYFVLCFTAVSCLLLLMTSFELIERQLYIIHIYYCFMCSVVSCFVRTIFDINPCKWFIESSTNWSNKCSSQPPPSNINRTKQLIWMPNRSFPFY